MSPIEKRDVTIRQWTRISGCGCLFAPVVFLAIVVLPFDYYWKYKNSDASGNYAIVEKIPHEELIGEWMLEDPFHFNQLFELDLLDNWRETVLDIRGDHTFVIRRPCPFLGLVFIQSSFYNDKKKTLPAAAKELLANDIEGIWEESSDSKFVLRLNEDCVSQTLLPALPKHEDMPGGFRLYWTVNNCIYSRSYDSPENQGVVWKKKTEIPSRSSL